ncbi:sulfatase-like hydrolase/transferase [bacterium]|nr:sulfatase-like hydrolase/transferase [bacterium]
MSVLKNNFWLLVKLNLILILAFTLYRLIFLAYNYHVFREIPLPDLILAFFQGVEFDLSAISKTFGIVFLVFLLMGKLAYHPWIFAFWKYLTFALLIIEVLVLSAGSLAFRYLNKHISYDIYSTVGEFSGLAKEAVSSHWLFILVISLIAIIPARLWLKTWSRHTPEGPVRLGGWLKYPALVLCFFLLSVLGVRGGFRPFPLYEAHAFTGKHQVLGNLRLNTVLTVSLALQRDRVAVDRFFPRKKAIGLAREVLKDQGEVFIDDDRPLLRQKQDPGPPSAQKLNYVMLILEGIPSSWIEGLADHDLTGLTPHLNRIIQQSRVYTNFFSNGYYTSDAFPAIMISVPIFHNHNLITNGMLQQHFVSIPSALKKIGYTTFFMNTQFHNTITVFMASIGFEKIVDEFDFKSDLKTAWGFQDEVTFERLHQELNQLQEPFFAAMINVSTHSPYELPNQKWDIFPGESEHDRHWKNVLHYTDHQIGRFMELEESRASFKNTVYIITADHTRNTPHGQFLKTFRIPMVIYTPGGQVQPGRVDTYSSHVDILPTLIDQLNIDTPHASAGISLFSPKKENGLILMTDKKSYFGIQHDRLYGFDEAMKLTAVYDIKSDPDTRHNLLGEIPAPSTDDFRGYKQTFLSLLTEGRVAR